MLKTEEKNSESERNKDKSQQNKKWIESLGFENLPVEERRTNEERMKNGEERRRTMKNFHIIAYESVSEAPRLRFSSRKQFFQANSKEREVPKGLNPFLLAFLPYL